MPAGNPLGYLGRVVSSGYRGAQGIAGGKRVAAGAARSLHSV